jgi:BAAT / Acyl-CoA thioester hydrolase C terminal
MGWPAALAVVPAGCGGARHAARRLYSGEYVKEIEHRLDAHGFPYAHDGHVYARAGHLVGSPVPYWPRPQTQGTVEGDAAARADLWPRILRFLTRMRTG